MATRPVLAPILTCEDVDKTYDYFTKVLGFAGQGKMPGPDGSTMRAEAFLPIRQGVARVLLAPLAFTEQNDPTEFGRNLRKGPLGNGVVLYFQIANVDEYHEFVRSNGGDIVQGPTDQSWGDRTILVRTPDGYFLNFATPIKGFRWPEEQLEKIHDARKPTAPGALKNVAIGHAATRRRSTKRAAARRTGRRTRRKGGR